MRPGTCHPSDARPFAHRSAAVSIRHCRDISSGQARARYPKAHWTPNERADRRVFKPRKDTEPFEVTPGNFDGGEVFACARPDIAGLGQFPEPVHFESELFDGGSPGVRMHYTGSCSRRPLERAPRPGSCGSASRRRRPARAISRAMGSLPDLKIATKQ